MLDRKQIIFILDMMNGAKIGGDRKTIKNTIELMDSIEVELMTQITALDVSPEIAAAETTADAILGAGEGSTQTKKRRRRKKSND